MTDHQFYTAFGEALAATGRDAYVSDMATSSLFRSPEDPPEIPADLIRQLGALWDVAHLSVREMRDTTGLSQAAFAERFCVPRRTVENWESRGGCPDYVRLLLAQSLGLYRRP